LKEGARVVQVRNTQDGEDRHRMQLDIELRANGSAKVNVIERLQGEGAVAWRQNLEGVPEADLEKRFEDEYVAHLVPGAILSSLKIIGRENPELEFQLEYSFNVASFGRRVTEGWALPGMLLSELATTYARISNRTTTEFVSPGIDRDVTLTIHVPQGTSFPRLPNELTYAGPNHASFRLANALKKGALIINRELRLPLMRVEPGHYTEFKNFCRSVDLAEAAEIVVKMP
jgi:cellulose synthase operon protein C